MTIARQVLAKYQGSTEDQEIHFTKYNVIKRKEEAIKKVAPILKAAGVDPIWVNRGHGINSIHPQDMNSMWSKL